MNKTWVAVDADAGNGFPYVLGKPSFTDTGTAYLTHPTVALISKPRVQLRGMLDWVRTFGDNDPGAAEAVETWCLDIEYTHPDTLALSDGERLIKAAGQLCYASFLGKFTPNRELPAYLENINRQGHGSVTEEANYTFFFGGVSRSWSHEAVRHRAGMSPAQLSQRYVDGRALRFVMRPEYEGTPEVTYFKTRCDFYAREYEALAERLRGYGIIDMSRMNKTDARKAINQVARELLPNSTETALVITGNARAWRHFLNMRASKHAEPEIRRTAYWVAWALKQQGVAQHLFADVQLPADWRDGVSILYTKP
jgi:thymidylate synthase (FAD)